MSIFEIISNELKFGGHFVCFLFIVLLSLYIAKIASGCRQKCLDIIVLTLHFWVKHMARVDSLRVDCRG